MLEMSWITAILQLYSQVTDLFGNVIVKCINIRLFDLLALFHYILNLPRISARGLKCLERDYYKLPKGSNDGHMLRDYGENINAGAYCLSVERDYYGLLYI